MTFDPNIAYGTIVVIVLAIITHLIWNRFEHWTKESNEEDDENGSEIFVCYGKWTIEEADEEDEL